MVIARMTPATYVSGLRFIVSPLDIGKVNWKIKAITINHNAENETNVAGFTILKLCGINLVNPNTIPTDCINIPVIKVR